MSEFKIKLDIESLDIIGYNVDEQGAIELEVKSNKEYARCHKCGKNATKRYGTAPELRIRHLPILDNPVHLRIRPVRYECSYCDDHTVTTEQYDWCERNSHVTKALERYVMRNLIHSTIQDVAKKEQISYNTIQNIVDRIIGTGVDWSQFKDLETIGIDEISLKKGYKDFVTIVSSRDSQGDLSVLAVLEGKKADTVEAFLQSIPEHLKSTVESVCCDMYEGYIQSAISVFGRKRLVIDRYHVAKLYRDSLDKLRIKEMKRLKKELSKADYEELEGMMWIVRKNHECLNTQEKEKLATLYKLSPKLEQAHRQAIKLTQTFNTHCSRKSGFAKINRWIKGVQKKGIECFSKFVGTLNRYKQIISNYFKSRKNSGFVEGLNNKIKNAKRRCFGALKAKALWQRMQIDLRGYEMFA